MVCAVRICVPPPRFLKGIVISRCNEWWILGRNGFCPYYISMNCWGSFYRSWTRPNRYSLFDSGDNKTPCGSESKTSWFIEANVGVLFNWIGKLNLVPEPANPQTDNNATTAGTSHEPIVTACKLLYAFNLVCNLESTQWLSALLVIRKLSGTEMLMTVLKQWITEGI